MLQTTWKTEYEKSTIFELCTDDNKSKCSSNRKDIFKSAEKIWNSTPSELLQLLLLNLFYEIPIRKKISNQYLIFVRLKYLEIIKSINSETNNKPPGNDGLTAEFYRHFSKWTNSCSFRRLWLPGKAWVLLIEEESYLSSGPYLGRITSRKRVGAQNEKHWNRECKITWKLVNNQ